MFPASLLGRLTSYCISLTLSDRGVQTISVCHFGTSSHPVQSVERGVWLQIALNCVFLAVKTSSVRIHVTSVKCLAELSLLSVPWWLPVP